MMKKIIANFSLAAVLSAFIFASSEVQLFSELGSAYSSNSYPVVVDLAEEFEKNYSSSYNLGQVLVYKGECLFKLKRYSEARNVLERAVLLCDNDSGSLIKGWFYLGRASMACGKIEPALENFYKLCSYSGTITKKISHYRNLSYFYSAECFFSSGRYEQAIPLFEKVLADGYLDVANYKSSFRMIFESYLALGRNQELVELYDIFRGKNYTSVYEDLFNQLTLHAGTAYENMGQYKKAYDCYETVLNSEDTLMASLALQKLYFVASNHQSQLGLPSADIFENAKENLFEYPDLLCEFWTRLGIDAFNGENFAEAEKYFDDAESYDREKKYLPLIGLYRAKMTDKNPVEVLLEYAQLCNLNKTHEMYGEYEIALAEYYSQRNDLENCMAHAKNAGSVTNSRSIKSKAVYYQAFVLYETKKIQECVRTLEFSSNLFVMDNDITRAEKLLYAKALALYGKTDDALEVFDELWKNGYLSEAELADYSSLLFSAGYLTKSVEVASSSKDPNTHYIKGLVAFNRGQWKKAESEFNSFLNEIEYSSKEGHGLFYLGYTQFKQKKFAESIRSFNIFSLKYPEHLMSWNGYITLANCYLQTRNFDGAASASENAIAVSVLKKQKEQSVLMCSSCYEDAGNIQMAIETLVPYAKEKSEFGARCRFEMALLYEKNNQIKEADLLLEEVQNKFTSLSIADEASYRRAELFYSQRDFTGAIDRFRMYQKKFPQGQYVVASHYYLADSYHCAGDDTTAGLRYSLMLDQFSLSEKNVSYLIAARKNLAQIYYDMKDFSGSLTELEKLLEMPVSDNEKLDIRKQIASVKKVSGGGNSELISLEEEYKTLGIKSLEGRNAGTRLVKILWENDLTKKRAFEIASKLYTVQSKESSGDDIHNAAANALVCAQSERLDKHYKSSAQYFLNAAMYARQSGQDELAQRCLYGAAEVFDVARLFGDSKAAASKLVELYPDSPYAKKVGEFLK